MRSISERPAMKHVNGVLIMSSGEIPIIVSVSKTVEEVPNEPWTVSVTVQGACRSETARVSLAHELIQEARIIVDTEIRLRLSSGQGTVLTNLKHKES